MNLISPCPKAGALRLHAVECPASKERPRFDCAAQGRGDGIRSFCRAEISESRNLQKERPGGEDSGVVCRRSFRKARFERREAVRVHDRRLGKGEAHSQQSTRERRSLRHARRIERRVGPSASGDPRRRGSATRHAAAEQKICALETTFGFLCDVSEARTHRFCDSPKLIRAFFEQGQSKDRLPPFSSHQAERLSITAASPTRRTSMRTTGRRLSTPRATEVVSLPREVQSRSTSNTASRICFSSAGTYVWDCALRSNFFPPRLTAAAVTLRGGLAPPLAEIAHENDIGFVLAARESQMLAVPRPVKGKHFSTTELGQLLGSTLL